MDLAEQFMYQLGWYKVEHFKKRGYKENKMGWGIPYDDKELYMTYYKNKKTPKETKIRGTVVGKGDTESI